MNDDELQAWIKKCEALRLKLYTDSLGYPSIGWGRCLTKGISVDEAELMFQNDFKDAVNQLEKMSWYRMQPPGVKQALINMNFNLGIFKLLKFKSMIAALEAKNYTLAAQEALNSLWATQVGQRAKDVAVMIRSGQ
jgi:lysozyme